MVETVMVDCCVPWLDKARLDGLRDTVGPEGDMLEVTVMFPANPPTLVIVSVDVPVNPAGIDK